MDDVYLQLAEKSLDKFGKAQDRVRAEFFWKEFQYWSGKIKECQLVDDEHAK